MNGSKPWFRMWQVWVGVAVLSCFGLGLLGSLDGTATGPSSALDVDDSTPTATLTTQPPSPSPSPSQSPKPTLKPVVLLYLSDQKDGDSFVATDGKEYRLGLVNTPEYNEPCGREATQFTRSFIGSGFTAHAYTTDDYGRHVAEVFDQSGRSLNVALAKSGLGNDKYFERYRSENPDLARRLDVAFAAADTPSCLKPAVAAPMPFAQQQPAAKQAPVASSNCMVGYDPCLPVRGDMNCPDIGHPVRVSGSDPYGLDRDGDGVGCD